MKKFYVASAFLHLKDSQVLAVIDFNQVKLQVITNKNWLTILEIFINEQSLETAYQRLLEVNASSPPKNLLQQCQQIHKEADDLSVMLGRQALKVYKQGFYQILDPEQCLDFTNISQETPYVTCSLFTQEVFAAKEANISSFEAFCQEVKNLTKLGLLSLAANTFDWGDFKRRFPLCRMFGFSRGTSIDRYYLSKFVSEIRPQVAGTVLEIGGTERNREIYQFDRAAEYQVIDIAPGPGVTYVGDVHNPMVIKPESLDTVVILNVLEHCHNPSAVVRNIHTWLRAGGQCFCLVPSAQRVHGAPKDYCRLLPDGMQNLFQDFSQQKLYIYGNLITTIATFMGISASELSSQELDDCHPDYPVATCIVAMK